jgi:hypothetical protein
MASKVKIPLSLIILGYRLVGDVIALADGADTAEIAKLVADAEAFVTAIKAL